MRKVSLKEKRRLKTAIQKYLNLNNFEESIASKFISKLKADLKDAITYAFETIGIGAKTSSGYGILKVIKVEGI